MAFFSKGSGSTFRYKFPFQKNKAQEIAEFTCILKYE